MSKKHIIAENAPTAIGTYSHAVLAGDKLFLSGQVGLNPETMKLAVGTEQQITQTFENVKSVIQAAGASLDDVIKVNIYAIDLSCFSLINEVMDRYFQAPYPARAAIGVAALPLGAEIEIEAIVQMQR